MRISSPVCTAGGEKCPAFKFVTCGRALCHQERGYGVKSILMCAYDGATTVYTRGCGGNRNTLFLMVISTSVLVGFLIRLRGVSLVIIATYPARTPNAAVTTHPCQIDKRVIGSSFDMSPTYFDSLGRLKDKHHRRQQRWELELPLLSSHL